MTARKRDGLHTRAGEAYHWVVLGVGITAGALAVLDWSRIWWVLPTLIGTPLLVWLQREVARGRRPVLEPRHERPDTAGPG